MLEPAIAENGHQSRRCFGRVAATRSLQFILRYLPALQAGKSDLMHVRRLGYLALFWRRNV
jgi:hypothetical protein